MMQVEALGLAHGDAQARLVDGGLSVRQLEILNWATLGKSNSDIAVITGMSKRAVAYHMSEILRKLKVASRTQAVALIAGGAATARRLRPLHLGACLKRKGMDLAIRPLFSSPWAR